jgi:hypothetical protein
VLAAVNEFSALDVTALNKFVQQWTRVRWHHSVSSHGDLLCRPCRAWTNSWAVNIGFQCLDFLRWMLVSIIYSRHLGKNIYTGEAGV